MLSVVNVCYMDETSALLYWCNIMLNSLINVMWLHCLNLQVYWLMKHGNSLKCIVFVMYQVASFQQMFAQRYLYDHQRKIMFCYFALVPVTCGFPCMHCWSRQEMLQQFFHKDLWERLVGISTECLQYKASTAECRVNYRDHMATWISKRTGATMARILCFDFGNASCTHSTKLFLVLL